MEKELIERIKGMLIGCAVGDSMGMATEFVQRSYIEKYFPKGVHTFSPSIPGSVYPRFMEAGEVTDDTIHTILVLEMLIKNKGRVEAGEYIAHLIQWVRENPEKSDAVSGPSTRRALEAIEKGISLEESGIMGTTNGAAMKIAPIGLIADYRDMASLADAVEQICKPTHNTDIAIAGACAVAACVSYGIQGGDDTDVLWDIAEAAIREGSRRGYRHPGISLNERLNKVRRDVSESSREQALWLLQNVYGTGVETAETIPAVFTIIRLAKGKPYEAAQIAAGIGGDTDTIGAIAGAICGSMHPHFEEETVGLLESVNGIDFTGLAEGIAPYCKNNIMQS